MSTQKPTPVEPCRACNRLHPDGVDHEGVCPACEKSWHQGAWETADRKLEYAKAKGE